MNILSLTRVVLIAVATVLVSSCGEEPRVVSISTSTSTSTSQAGSSVAKNLTAEKTGLTVYKSPSCGCCGQWVEHIEQYGFAADIRHPEDLNAIKVQYQIAPVLQSCHTAVSTDGYVFEGHIPARFIQQFLDNPPPGAKGLSVPGMPVGSPGMEVDQRFMPYQVMLIKADGSTEVYISVATADQQSSHHDASMINM